jgi:endonuclease/exonuclease/phosphatase family metal-dependent hydrolase
VVVVRIRPLDDPEGWRADHDVLLESVRSSAPDLVLGDLNATADHRQLQALAEEGLRDVAEVAGEGWQPTWPAHLVPLARLDHVLVGPRLTALSSRTREVAGSDHAAVLAEVRAEVVAR